MNRLIVLAALFSMVMIGCRNLDWTTNGGGGDAAPVGKILVEYEYTNHAWGYAHKGFYVDNTGRVFGYEWSRQGNTYWESKESGRYTEAELLAKYNHTPVETGTVSADTLALIRRLILPSSRGALGERQMRAADMGQTDRIAYRYDSASATYQYVLLLSTGDWDQRNLAPEAAQLAEIIDSIAAGR